MQVTIQSVADLGVAVRSVRRASKVRLDDLAATASVSKQFASDVEHGKPTVQLGLVLRLLSELGVPLKLEIPKEAETELAAQRTKAVRPYGKQTGIATTQKRNKKSLGPRNAD
ncbi:MAG: helix-turn-helix transcriptional regulator [Steroidobacteraceae bacterium]